MYIYIYIYIYIPPDSGFAAGLRRETMNLREFSGIRRPLVGRGV